MWLQQFKIAVLEKNADAIIRLLDEMPQLSDVGEMEDASYLLVEAARILKSQQDETRDSLMKIKQNIKFLQSTQTDKPAQLDLTL